ncbi:hypothetical protein FAGKG844_20001 [Frankia sp. AgKG'84/4]
MGRFGDRRWGTYSTAAHVRGTKGNGRSWRGTTVGTRAAGQRRPPRTGPGGTAVVLVVAARRHVTAVRPPVPRGARRAVVSRVERRAPRDLRVSVMRRPAVGVRASVTRRVAAAGPAPPRCGISRVPRTVPVPQLVAGGIAKEVRVLARRLRAEGRRGPPAPRRVGVHAPKAPLVRGMHVRRTGGRVRATAGTLVRIGEVPLGWESTVAGGRPRAVRPVGQAGRGRRPAAVRRAQVGPRRPVRLVASGAGTAKGTADPVGSRRSPPGGRASPLRLAARQRLPGGGVPPVIPPRARAASPRAMARAVRNDLTAAVVRTGATVRIVPLTPVVRTGANVRIVRRPLAVWIEVTGRRPPVVRIGVHGRIVRRSPVVRTVLRSPPVRTGVNIRAGRPSAGARKANVRIVAGARTSSAAHRTVRRRVGPVQASAVWARLPRRGPTGRRPTVPRTVPAVGTAVRPLVTAGRQRATGTAETRVGAARGRVARPPRTVRHPGARRPLAIDRRPPIKGRGVPTGRATTGGRLGLPAHPGPAARPVLPAPPRTAPAAPGRLVKRPAVAMPAVTAAPTVRQAMAGHGQEAQIGRPRLVPTVRVRAVPTVGVVRTVRAVLTVGVVRKARVVRIVRRVRRAAADVLGCRHRRCRTRHALICWTMTCVGR